MPKITILCEDIDQERFIRQYLICRGVSKRDISTYPNVKRNKVENNNASILRDYPKLVNSYRSKKHQDLAIVVMIDADDTSPEHRLRSLNMALDESEGKLNKELRIPGEKIAIFVPARNIETWFTYINGNGDCDETTDYKDSNLSKKSRIESAHQAATKLATEICPKGIDEISLNSLQLACKELQRLQLK
ncbi:hypothetical protein [Oscillatoria sp. FACHB-1406]|uniref:hypothetical protein n=1 Tax=Oscillatoria sp. FACHB-1406 TaxID=2692846 RepID=UPI0016826526|nr:hypothetical protein [Oscillatoria sp. FACHB-1406]MBD2579987.1 hypothetical protein [Oscillatoria sp. FACHB-1406]